MATIVTVHGTFAQPTDVSPVEAAAEAAAMWWQPGSVFEGDIRRMVEGETGPVEIHRFTWNGENSEQARRDAGHRLYRLLGEFEAAKQSYALIGHSHGGSIISLALLEAAAHRQSLTGLKRWITVGTPFVELKREPFLFTRLPFLFRAIYVASLMLLIMFAFTAASDLLDGPSRFLERRQTIRVVVGTLLTALPFLLVYIGLRIYEGRQRQLYRPRALARAKDMFAARWVALTHEDDEAVQGLATLGRVRFSIFQKQFAVPAITMASVFILPLAYLIIVTSPSLMRNIAETLKTHVYAVQDYEARGAELDAARRDLRQITRDIRTIEQKLEDSTTPFAQSSDMKRQAETLRTTRAAKQRRLDEVFPNLTQAERALRFKRRFLEIDGKPCDGGGLCYRGQHVGLNSKLLFHLVTDEVSSAVVDEEIRRSALGNVLRFVLPILLVPIVFGLLAIGILLLVQLIAGFVSARIARWLDLLTWSELKRASLGNDTEGEIALKAAAHPVWITPAPPFLPAGLGSVLTEHSNRETALSLSKFRNAISDLAFADQSDQKSDAITKYLSWRELIHTSYFEVAVFRQLVARILADAEGFRAAPAFATDAGFARAGEWLAWVVKPAPTPGSAAALVAAATTASATPMPAAGPTGEAAASGQTASDARVALASLSATELAPRPPVVPPQLAVPPKG